MLVDQIILASTSSYRSALLRSTGLDFVALSSQADEHSITDINPVSRAKKRAELKASHLQLADAKVSLAIGADQVLDFKGQSFGKVNSQDEARERLNLLQGNEHTLHSAYALVLHTGAHPCKLLRCGLVSSVMKMRPLSQSEIEAYLNFGEWHGSSACYQFEGRGIHLFEPVKAEQSAIIGLPLSSLLNDLRTIGIDPLLQPNGPWTLN